MLVGGRALFEMLGGGEGAVDVGWVGLEYPGNGILGCFVFDLGLARKEGIWLWIANGCG